MCIRDSVKEAPIFPTSKQVVSKSFSVEVGGQSGSAASGPAEDEVRGVYLTELDDSVELPEDDVGNFLATLEEHDLGETEVLEIFAAV
eukprot:8613293-Pyramimonas_sp.AAC.1